MAWSHLDVPDEGHGDSLLKLVERRVQVQDLHNLQQKQMKSSTPAILRDGGSY